MLLLSLESPALDLMSFDCPQRYFFGGKKLRKNYKQWAKSLSGHAYPHIILGGGRKKLNPRSRRVACHILSRRGLSQAGRRLSQHSVVIAIRS